MKFVISNFRVVSVVRYYRNLGTRVNEAAYNQSCSHNLDWTTQISDAVMLNTVQYDKPNTQHT